MADALSKASAMDVVYDFEQKGTFGAFSKVPRKLVAEGLRERILNPSAINTSNVNLCGPAALAVAYCRDYPVKYAHFACQLYDKGRAMMGTLEVVAGGPLRVSNPPLDEFNGGVNAADWVVLASIRDSENFVTDFSTADAGFGGITLPGALKEWFIACGYSDVIEEGNVWFNKDEAHARRANNLRNAGYHISMFINAQMLETETQNDWSSIPTHWIMLTSKLTISYNCVWFECFTWGQGNRSVPQSGSLTLEGFLKNYYGFVAAKA